MFTIDVDQGGPVTGVTSWGHAKSLWLAALFGALLLLSVAVNALIILADSGLQ